MTGTGGVVERDEETFMKKSDDGRVSSQIQSVTVYLAGAQVTRGASVPVAPGRVVVTGLPAALRPDSIQVAAAAPLTVVSVQHTIDYIPQTGTDQLARQLTELRRRREDEQNAIDLGAAEERFLEANMHLGGKQAGLKADDLRAGLDLFNERVAGVRRARLEAGRRVEEIDRDISELERQVGVRPDDTALVGQIAVTLAAPPDATGEAALRVAYVTDEAAWTPSYDVRVAEIGADVMLHARAHITQTTGEDWRDVDVTLSTGTPQIDGSCPRLEPWYLDTPRPLPIAAAPIMADMAVAAMRMAAPAFGMSQTLASPPVQSVASVEYALGVPLSVASGREGQDIEIATHQVPATYRYVAIPKLMPKAYLLAAVDCWQGLNLIAGEAAVFSGESYVGRTFLDPADGKRTLDVSLGPDKAVTVTRTRGRDAAAKTLIGANLKQTRRWELAVANLKPVPIDVELVDQVPVPVTKQVSVDVDATAAAHDADTGRLTWRLALAPGERTTVAFQYTVTAPQDADLILE